MNNHKVKAIEKYKKIPSSEGIFLVLFVLIDY